MNRYYNWLKQLVRGETLASQILLYFFVSAFIASLIVGSIAYFTARYRIKTLLEDRLNDNAGLMTTYIAQTIAAAYFDAQLLSYNSVITSSTSSLSEKLVEIEKTQWLRGLFEDITLMDSQGEILLSTNKDISVADREATKEVYRTVMTIAPNIFISDVYYLSDIDHRVIIIGAPVFNKEYLEQWDVALVITAQMNMENIWRFTDRMKIGNTGYAAIIDSSNHYIAHPDKDMLSMYVATKDISGEEDKLFTYKETENGDNRTGLIGQPISNPFWVDKGWRVVVSQDSDEAFHYIRQTLWTVLIVLSVASLLFILVGLYISRRLSKPLQDLAKGTQRVAMGEFSYRMDIERRDEIGQLVKAYNEMAAKLEQRESDSLRLQALRKRVARWSSVSSELSIEKYLVNLTRAVIDTYGCFTAWAMLASGQRLESKVFLSLRPEAQLAIENALGQDINRVSFDLQSDDNLFTRAFNTKHTIFVNLPTSSGHDIVDSLLLGEYGGMAVLPLYTGRDCRGVLVVVQDTSFSAEQKENILALALNSSVALENALLYEAAQRQNQEKARLYEMASVMTSSLDFHNVLERAVDGVRSLIPSPETSWVAIASYDELTGTLTYEVSRGISDVVLDGLKVKLDETTKQEIIPVLQGKITVIQDMTNMPEKQRFPAYLLELINKVGIKSWITLPLQVRGKSIGTLRICNRLPVLPSSEQMEALRNLANNIAIAMDNARLYETAHGQSQEKSRLYELASAMSSSLDIQQVLDRALDGVMSLVPSPETAWIIIFGYDEQAGIFIYKASRGAPDSSYEDSNITVHEKLKEWLTPVLKGNIMMFQNITSPSENQNIPLFLYDTMIKTGMKSWMVMPLMFRERLIGTLRICNRLPVLPTEQQIEALRNLANNIAIAMENASLFTQEQQRAAELQRLEKLKTDFMLAISHELKTPLTSLVVSTGLLQEEIQNVPDMPVSRLLTGIANSVERLNRLISDLLEAARLESSVLELNWEVIDLVTIVKAIASRFSLFMESKEQQFIVDVPQGKLWAKVDLQRVEQILTNLLSNANKFTPEGGLIRLVLKEEGQNFIMEVSDTGPGISEEEQKRIFEPFYRVRGTPRHTGSGLGLAISRRLTELHDGSITVTSNLGQGSTFIVTIPRRVSE